MIHVVKEKHLNDFKLVHCVRPKDLYARLGHRKPNTSFESSEVSIPMNQSKIDFMESLLHDYDRYMEEQAQRESAGAVASPEGDDVSVDASEV